MQVTSTFEHADEKYEPWSWDLMIHIDLDVARGLEYLHDGVNFHLIYVLVIFTS